MLDIAEKRMNICKQCPLYKESSYGPVCNSSKFISPDGKDWSWLNKKGYIRGCGCRLNNKTKNPNSKCIVNLW